MFNSWLIYKNNASILLISHGSYIDCLDQRLNSVEATMQNYNYPECLTRSSTNITNLSTNPSIGGQGRVCTIAK